MVDRDSTRERHQRERPEITLWWTGITPERDTSEREGVTFDRVISVAMLVSDIASSLSLLVNVIILVG